MLDNVLTYKRSNARVSHRVIERVSKYKQESASISKGFRKVGEIPRYMYLKVSHGQVFLLEPLLSHNNTELFH